ncbi:MAG TPA: hypothetical protein DEO60_06870 [Bacteroidales bacterium]|nr:hypothetical protein [Bacteroidales bacterium]HBZ20829.1 hypothetical protein [Bacteroidales bacterium]
MKKGASILFAFVIIAAMFRFSVAIHYCGGHIAASKISLTGKLASCGMEDSQKKSTPPGIFFSRHCCEDAVTSFSTDNNYVPSFFNVTPPVQIDFQTAGLSSESTISLAEVFKIQYSDKSPPGAIMSTNVDLSEICIFRI